MEAVINTAGKSLYDSLTGGNTPIGDIYDNEVANIAAKNANPAYQKGEAVGGGVAAIEGAVGLAGAVKGLGSDLA